MGDQILSGPLLEAQTKLGIKMMLIYQDKRWMRTRYRHKWCQPLAQYKQKTVVNKGPSQAKHSYLLLLPKAVPASQQPVLVSATMMIPQPFQNARACDSLTALISIEPFIIQCRTQIGIDLCCSILRVLLFIFVSDLTR